MERSLQIELSVSVTTRPKRPNEEDGKDYHFISKEKFNAMRDAGDLIEHAQVFSNWYGTPRAPVEKALSQGLDILFDIDWQGVRQLAEYSRKDLVSLFLLPPSAEALEHRLMERAQDTEDVIRDRMKMASEEVSHYDEYDYIVLNHDLLLSVQQAEAILRAEHLRPERLPGLNDFAEDLQKQLKQI